MMVHEYAFLNMAAWRKNPIFETRIFNKNKSQGVEASLLYIINIINLVKSAPWQQIRYLYQ